MHHSYIPKHLDLRECLQHFHMLFSHIRIGVIIADKDGTIIYYNQAQAGIDNMDAATVLEKNMVEVYDFTKKSSPALQVLRKGHSVIDAVNSYRTRSGTLVNASCTIYPLRAQNGAIIGVICYSQNMLWLDIQLQNVRDGLFREGVQARKAPSSAGHYTFASLAGNNAALQKAVDMATIAAHNDSSVMLVGETGVGKEIFAQSIHYAGSRRSKPYTAINCSAVPESLLEGILFGTTKGAFTGALDKAGLFEVAHGGTLFLDEVDSMPLGLQRKLLRALQEKKIRRVGEGAEREVDVRIISAVGAPPLLLMEQGSLRPDFYYRLGVIKIALPPLRERLDDLPALVRHFLEKHSARIGRDAPHFSPEAMVLLQQHHWPGNVRELEHALEAALSLMGAEDTVSPQHITNACPDIEKNQTDTALPTDGTRKQAGEKPQDLSTATNTGSIANARDSIEIDLLRKALQKAAGNKGLAARLLHISPQLLHYKIKKFKLRTEDFTPNTL